MHLEDESLDIWVGVIPIRFEVLPPIADQHVRAGRAAPDRALDFSIG